MMRRILLFLLIPTFVAAQVNGNAPTLVQSMNSDEDVNPVSAGVRLKAATAGNLIAGCVRWDNNSSTSITISFSDGATPTQTSPVLFNSHNNFAMFYAVKSGTGDVDITSGGIAQELSAGEFTNISSTTDFSFKNSTYSGTPSSITDSGTTTVSGDLLVACGDTTSNWFGFGNSPQQLSANGNTELMDWQLTGAAGSYSDTMTVNTAVTWAHGMLSFKTAAQAITTTALPQAAQNVAYKACLSDVGVGVAPTWSITAGALPTGLTINSGTGCISGTPSGGIGTSSFTASDGTATASLSIGVVASFGTPTLRSFTTSNTGVVWTLSGVINQDALVLCFLGHDSANTSWIEPPSTYVWNPLVVNWTRMRRIPGGKSGGNICWSGTAAGGAGSYTLSVASSHGNGTPIGSVLMDWGNAQYILDDAVDNLGSEQNTSWSLTASNYPANVPNEVLVSMITTPDTGVTLGFNSPISLLTQFNTGFSSIALGTEAVTTATTYSATGTSTGLGIAKPTIINLFGIRPGVIGTATFLGEKRRRRVY